MTDVVDMIVGIAPGSPLDALRAQRPEARQLTQGSYDELVVPGRAGGVALDERAAVALRIAVLNEDAALAAHYRTLLATHPGGAALAAKVEAGPEAAGLAPRLAAILRHVDRVSMAPRTAGAAHLAALKDVGLSDKDIVSLSQLVAFVSHQVRLIAGLRLLQE
ncbi:MAG: CMD domain protein [Alphaproteobacteria bacterium]|nr:CMD domain protein [Alphaproteobacteria bacterium]